MQNPQEINPSPPINKEQGNAHKAPRKQPNLVAGAKHPENTPSMANMKLSPLLCLGRYLYWASEGRDS